MEIGSEKLKDFLVYPNPTNSELNIRSNNFIDGVEVFSLTGKSILKSSSETVDVSHLSAGTYFISVKTTSGLRVTKFIKN